MCRVISELRPAWVLGENVPGIVNLALDQCISDLEDQDYEVQTFDIPACAVNAPHRRARIFILAYSKHNECSEQERKHQGTEEPPGCGTERVETGDDVANSVRRGCRKNGKQRSMGTISEKRQNYTMQIEEPSSYVADTIGLRQLQSQRSEQKERGRASNSGANVPNPSRELPHRRWQARRRGAEPPNRDWWAIEPNMGRVANGIPSRVDRLKCLGNAVVPQQVYPILAAIAEIEEGLK